ncbi:hypothetical protein T492DRAFT_1042284 [Pavlovales sp. CCMP2436]|nr:hypothetical protein T492DRAFT_1042284 [Pavlovales sp. CCMP2436]
MGEPGGPLGWHFPRGARSAVPCRSLSRRPRGRGTGQLPAHHRDARRRPLLTWSASWCCRPSRPTWQRVEPSHSSRGALWRCTRSRRSRDDVEANNVDRRIAMCLLSCSDSCQHSQGRKQAQAAPRALTTTTFQQGRLNAVPPSILLVLNTAVSESSQSRESRASIILILI